MEDWNDIPETEVITSETFNKGENSAETLTTSIKKMMYGPVNDDIPSIKRKIDKDILPQFDSIYEIARAENKTVSQFVHDDPLYAQRVAENTAAEWQNILTMAALKGAVTMMDEDGEEHDYAITKNQTHLIEIRVKEANKQLEMITEMLLTCTRDDELRKDTLERAMYQRALHGDTRMAIYLHDRIDGHPAESKVVENNMDNAYNIYAILHTLFDKQLEVLNSGSGTKLICCSRRAGKTHMLVAVEMIECMRKPRTKCLYIGETMDLTESLIDKAANDIIDVCGLKDNKGRRLNWKKFDNGSEIMVRGLSNTKDPDLIRGNAAKIIVVDEFFHLKSELLEYMQREVLEPMQMDYADDYMFICAGTPPQIKGTYGEHVWRTWNCDHFSWTWRDNPHPVSVEARKKYIDHLLEEKGLDWSSSYARREYNGEWAYDEDLLLYPVVHTYDPRENVPECNPSRVVFGIDYGVGDNDTLWGAVWDDDKQFGYQFWEEKFNRLDIMNLHVSQLEYLCDKVKMAWEIALDFFPNLPMKERNKRILWDADDNDQHLTDYMNTNVRIQYKDEETGEDKYLGLNIQNAHKTDKVIMFDKLRDTLRRGDLLLIKGGKCEHECMSTILKRGPNGEVFTDVDMKAYHPDLLPAMRYAMYNIIGGF